MKHIRSFIFLGLLVSCSLYSYWLSNRDYEWIVPYMTDRAPAAVRESKEFQEILDKPLRVFKRDVVASSIEVDQHGEKSKLSFGQFSVAASHGPNLVCLEYPYVRLSWVAEGRSVSGKKTRVWVKAPCKIHQKNSERVSDIPLPFEELYRRPAQDQSWPWQESGMDLQVDVENVFGEWPRLWELESIEFFKESDKLEDMITLSKQEIMEASGEPLLVRF